MVEFDWTSKIFWAGLISALLLWIPYMNEVFGWAIPIPSAEQATALVTILVSAIVIFRAFFTDNPAIKLNK